MIGKSLDNIGDDENVAMLRFNECEMQLEEAEILDQKIVDLSIFPGSSRTVVYSPRVSSAKKGPRKLTS